MNWTGLIMLLRQIFWVINVVIIIKHWRTPNLIHTPQSIVDGFKRRRWNKKHTNRSGHDMDRSHFLASRNGNRNIIQWSRSIKKRYINVILVVRAFFGNWITLKMRARIYSSYLSIGNLIPNIFCLFVE